MNIFTCATWTTFLVSFFLQKLEMDNLFRHEFSPVPFSLCDHQDLNLFNQQKKSELMNIFEKEFPQCFLAQDPKAPNERWALVIDGGPLLETRPTKANGTILDYATQLLCTIIIPQLKNYDRVDIVFDSHRSKSQKSFIRRHGYDRTAHQQNYDLKPNDIIESTNFQEFVHRHRAKLAQAVRSCWTTNDLISLLPSNKVLIIAGPQDEAIKLLHRDCSSSGLSSEIVDLLESDHAEADTRLFLHVYDIQTSDDDGIFQGIVIQSNDTDVFVLSLAHNAFINISKCFIQKINSSSRSSTFINVKDISESSKSRWNIRDTNVFLVLHAISGCDTTSFIRGITKTNYFMTYLENSSEYGPLLNFGVSQVITQNPIDAAEKLLLSCLRKKRGKKIDTVNELINIVLILAVVMGSSETSLDSLRKNMAINYVKSQASDIYSKLPPSSDSFEQHCRRAWRQVFVWRKAFEPFDLVSLYLTEDFGYEQAKDGEIKLRWITLTPMPNNVSLTRCTKCKSGCQRCKCAVNKLMCTPLCACSIDECMNHISREVTICFFISFLFLKLFYIKENSVLLRENATKSRTTNVATFDDDDDEEEDISTMTYIDDVRVDDDKSMHNTHH